MGVGFEGKRGWLPPQNILSRHFEKYLHGMVLKLSGHVRNTISLLYKQKTGWIPIFGTFLAKKLIFFSICLNVWKRHCDVIRWPIFMILVSMEKRDPVPWYQTIIIWARRFQVHKGGGNIPLVNHVTKKGLVGRGLMLIEKFTRKLTYFPVAFNNKVTHPQNLYLYHKCILKALGNWFEAKLVRYFCQVTHFACPLKAST